MALLFLVLSFLLAPAAVFAYLDPGSGAVLINLLIAGVAALLYSVKGVIFRLFGRKKDKESKSDKSSDETKTLGILSEGAQYWATFKPIVEALIERQIDFVYYTLDIQDPALDVYSDHMQVRFLGYGHTAYLRASKLKVKNLICTTPNIGSPGYPIRKSVHVHNLIHVFHSINDLSMYKKGSLDHYNTVFMVGSFQEKSIRELERKRSLTPKTLVSLGIPYLDTYKRELEDFASQNQQATILVASSWGSKGLFNTYGIEFIKDLAEASFQVIVRPHPQSYVSEASLMQRYEKELTSLPNIEWDRQVSPAESMHRADLLISDTSSIRFDYAFLLQKPVITLKVESHDMPGFERDDLDELWMEDAAKEIGKVLDKDGFSNIVDEVSHLINSDISESIVKYRDQTIVNYGKTGKAMAEYLQSYLA